MRETKRLGRTGVVAFGDGYYIFGRSSRGASTFTPVCGGVSKHSSSASSKLLCDHNRSADDWLWWHDVLVRDRTYKIQMEHIDPVDPMVRGTALVATDDLWRAVAPVLDRPFDPPADRLG